MWVSVSHFGKKHKYTNMKKIIIVIIAAMFAFSASAAYASDAAEVSVQLLKKVKKQKGEIKEVTFSVHLHCANCVKKVEENIAFEKGVKDLKVSLDDQTVYVKYDASKTSEAALKTAIEALGYPVAGEAEHHHHK